jgi:catechol 2,3-dioxygenase-like lactoylglutathione lyase family enzyme
VLVGLGHVDLVCTNLERSLAFYATVFGPLGLKPPATFPGERGEAIHYLRFPVSGSGSLGLRQASGPEAAQEFALSMRQGCTTSPSRSIRRRTSTAPTKRRSRLERGSCTPPWLWAEYGSGYYATFFLDPDGFRIEVASKRDAR